MIFMGEYVNYAGEKPMTASYRPKSMLLRLVCDSPEAPPGHARRQSAGLWLLHDLAKSSDARTSTIADTDPHMTQQRQLEAMTQDRRSHAQPRALHLKLLECERDLLGPPGGIPSLERNG